LKTKALLTGQRWAKTKSFWSAPCRTKTLESGKYPISIGSAGERAAKLRASAAAGARGGRGAAFRVWRCRVLKPYATPKTLDSYGTIEAY
jgi:hypothetical protein